MLWNREREFEVEEIVRKKLELEKNQKNSAVISDILGRRYGERRC